MDYLTPKQVCALLQISKRTLYRLVASGKFPAPLKVGNQNRWKPEALPHD